MGRKVLFLTALAMLTLPAVARANHLPARLQTDSYGTSWHQVGADNFTVAAPLGSWAASTSAQVVYRGDHGMRWRVNPDGGHCTRSTHCYMPSKVLSVHNGMLDYWLHPCRYPDGFVGGCAAAPQSIIPAHGSHLASQYQTYGRYSARMRVRFGRGKLNDYHMAWLLWPTTDANQACAESDFPEMNLRHFALVSVFAHYGCTTPHVQDHFSRRTDLTRWHVYTQEWGPGYRRFYIDRHLVGQSTTDVYAKPERWSLHVAVWDELGSSGHVLVDWVWIGRA